jgi:hypothetical protein
VDNCGCQSPSSPVATDFLLGANLPWISYGDFGANAWHPRGGLAERSDLARIAEMLAGLHDLGIRAVRWFVLCDGRAGIRFDSSSEPVGLDDAVSRDFDTALALVQRAGLALVPVLFDFLWCARRRAENGVQTGGRFEVLNHPRKRDALVRRVVQPLLQQYGSEPAILAWDVMNEPEWITRGVGTRRPWRTLTVESARTWLGLLVGAVHRHTRHAATVGSASAHWLGLVRGLGLDVYQPHWYDRLERHAPLASALSAATLDAPAWLGELPTAGSRRSVTEIIETARAAGYAGAFLWSVLATDTASDFATARPLLARSSTAHGATDESTG